MEMTQVHGGLKDEGEYGAMSNYMNINENVTTQDNLSSNNNTAYIQNYVDQKEGTETGEYKTMRKFVNRKYI